MENFTPNFRLIYSQVNWLEYRSQQINLTEVESAYQDIGKELYSIKEPSSGEWFYYFIGFSSQKRFLLVLLNPNKDIAEQLIVYKILIADEPQIKKLYYAPKFK